MKIASIIFLIISGIFQIYHIMVLNCGNSTLCFIASAISIVLAFLSKDRDFFINIMLGNLAILLLPNLYRLFTTGSS
ncbi:MAG: hypothetical protein Q4P31_05260 [Andreesenia angusta]|nr:hypothetical protein [Andreesenia angusta]